VTTAIFSGNTGAQRRRRLFRAVVAAVVLAVSLIACRGAELRGELPEYVSSELESASEFEREIIGDGKVTAAEYERAVFATLSCLDDHGLPHSEAIFNDEASRWDYQIGPWTEEEDAENYALFLDCWENHEQGVESVWVNQNAPSEANLQQIREAILMCLREHGLQADDYPTFVESQGRLTLPELEIAFACKSAAYR
jgi:hypothetical protein